MTTENNLTSDIVVGLYNHLSKRYHSAIVEKEDSAFMGSAGWALEKMGILDAEDFMKNFASTIFYTIYLPYQVGNIFGRWDLTSQLLIGVHEHHHVYQCQSLGAIQFSTSYLATKSGRAHWEAEAYRTGLEIYWYLEKRILDINQIAPKLLNYGCGWDEVNYMKSFLEMSVPIIKQGGIMSPVSKDAIEYLKGRGL